MVYNTMSLRLKRKISSFPKILAPYWVKSEAISIIMQAFKKKALGGFPGGSVVKNLPANAGDMASIHDLGRSHILQSN